MVEVKRCQKCAKVKNCTEFHRSDRQPDGRERLCASCRRQRRGSSGGFWGANDARAFAEEREAAAKRREEDERRDLETAAILRAHRKEIAGR